MIQTLRILTLITLFGPLASSLLAENPQTDSASPADSQSTDVVIFSGESVWNYTTKKHALVDSTLPPPSGEKSARVEFWRRPHNIVIGPPKGSETFSPSQIDWAAQDLAFEYRTEGVPKILALSLFIPVGGSWKEALVLKNSPALQGLEIDGRWHTAVVDVDDWQTPFKVALAGGKIPQDASVGARIGLKVAHNGAINIANLRAASKASQPKTSEAPEPAAEPTPEPAAEPAAEPTPEPSAASENPPVSSRWNDTARFLAGLPPFQDSALMELAKTPAWQNYAKNFDAAWSALEKNQLSKVTQWAKAQIPNQHNAESTVFYMFSGPDFIYANALFPKASTLVMCGIEPVGPTPDVSALTPAALEKSLQSLRNSLDSVMSFSFFITKEMKGDLQGHAINGSLPILSIFLARSGKTITEIQHLNLDAEGRLSELPDGPTTAKSQSQGVRIRFLSEGDNQPQTLYFFSTDISNGGLAQSGFLKFCSTLAPGNSFVKSASYTMHESHFSNIRSYLLENSSTLVQDDSGIPCSFFEPEKWTLQVHGSYPGPIPIFKHFYQAKLAELYRTSKPAPLGFGIGYRHRAGESTLIVATRRPDPVTNAGQSASELAKQ